MELRTHGASIPIIAMSDGGRTKQIELLGDAKLLGAVRTVAKPGERTLPLSLVRTNRLAYLVLAVLCKVEKATS